MGRNLIETIMGAVVLLVAGFFLIFATSQADLGAVKGYPLTASFLSVGGLPNGADVKINGIKVGTVSSQAIDQASFNAVVTMSIRPDIHLPVDTQAAVDSEGLLGQKFLNLLPGHSAQTIPAGGTIAKTKSYKSLEEMVGEIVFLATDNNAPAGKGEPPAPVPQPSPVAPLAAPVMPPPAPVAPPSAGAEPVPPSPVIAEPVPPATPIPPPPAAVFAPPPPPVNSSNAPLSLLPPPATPEGLSVPPQPVTPASGQ